MEITYDIVVDNFQGRGPQFLDSWIPTEDDALQLFAERRKQFPNAYLVRNIRVRCLFPTKEGTPDEANRSSTTPMHRMRASVARRRARR